MFDRDKDVKIDRHRLNNRNYSFSHCFTFIFIFLFHHCRFFLLPANFAVLFPLIFFPSLFRIFCFTLFPLVDLSIFFGGGINYFHELLFFLSSSCPLYIRFLFPFILDSTRFYFIFFFLSFFVFPNLFIFVFS